MNLLYLYFWASVCAFTVVSGGTQIFSSPAAAATEPDFQMVQTNGMTNLVYGIRLKQTLFALHGIILIQNACEIKSRLSPKAVPSTHTQKMETENSIEKLS